jgi:hypothetical protein
MHNNTEQRQRKNDVIWKKVTNLKTSYLHLLLPRISQTVSLRTEEELRITMRLERILFRLRGTATNGVVVPGVAKQIREKSPGGAIPIRRGWDPVPCGMKR